MELSQPPAAREQHGGGEGEEDVRQVLVRPRGDTLHEAEDVLSRDWMQL